MCINLILGAGINFDFILGASKIPVLKLNPLAKVMGAAVAL
jgi:hypothetical protein